MFGEEDYWKEKVLKVLDKYSLEQALETLDVDPQDALRYLIDYGFIDEEDVDDLLEDNDDN